MHNPRDTSDDLNAHFLDKLKEGLRSHRQVDAVRALRELIKDGLAIYRDDYPDEHPNVPLKTCVDIVRAIDTLLPVHVPDNCAAPSTHEEYAVIIDACDAPTKAYRYFDYKEAMQDADRHLQDYGPDATISVSKVLAVSKTTRTMARV